MPQNAMSIPKEAFEIAKAGVYKAKKGKSQRWPTSLDPSSAANEPQLQVPQPAHLSHEIRAGACLLPGFLRKASTRKCTVWFACYGANFPWPQKEHRSEFYLTEISGQLIKNPFLTRLQGIFHLLSLQGRNILHIVRKNRTKEILIKLAHCTLCSLSILFVLPFNIQLFIFKLL